MKSFILSVGVISAMLALQYYVNRSKLTPERMDPEETGFHEAFGEDIQVAIPAAHEILLGENKLNQSSFDSIKAVSQRLDQWRKAEPPKEMAGLHQAMIRLLDRAITDPEAQNLVQLKADCDSLIAQELLLTQRLSRRPNLMVATEFSVEFKPVGTPATIDLKSGKVSIGCEARTPLGTFSVSASKAKGEGVRILRIISHGKARYYSTVGRGFRLPVDKSLMILDGKYLTLDADAIKATN